LTTAAVGVVNTPGLVLCLGVELASVISDGGSAVVAEMVLALMPVVETALRHADVLVAMEISLLVSYFQVQKPLLVRHVWPS
jgi:hypothetical protein